MQILNPRVFMLLIFFGYLGTYNKQQKQISK